jgi:acyl-CoA thioesterase I
MDIGMAGQIARKPREAIGLALGSARNQASDQKSRQNRKAGANPHRQSLSLLLELALALASSLAVAARAEDAPAPAAPPLSPACQAPAADIAAPEPLPNFAAALKQHRPVRILAIGSSSTLGVGASSDGKTYPSQLEDILEHSLKDTDIELINRGVSGETAQITADRIKTEAALAKPDLVLWQLGTNDALSRVDPSEFANTVRSTVRWLQENQIDVVLVGLQYTPRFSRDEAYAAIREVLRQIASDEKILYVRRYDAMRFIARTRANLDLMSKDNFHLNDLGYRCMAEHVAHAVIVSLYLKKPRPSEN